MSDFEIFNDERLALLAKKYIEGLTDEEEKRLAVLQEEVSKRLPHHKHNKEFKKLSAKTRKHDKTLDELMKNN